MEKSPFLGIKQLETQVNGIFSSMDVYELDKPQQKIVTAVRRELVDARLDIRDYELSETRTEQLANAKSAHARIDTLRKYILSASEYDIFGAVDVAQLTAQLEQIAEYIY